jgi:hypothetical protein
LATVAKAPPTPSYPVSIAACAHAAPIAQLTLTTSAGATLAPLAAESPATDWSPARSAIESEISFFDWVGAVPTAREHSYPYAVGPPRRGIHPPLRVAGKALPGDSPTRRSQVSRIARAVGFYFVSGAHVTRTADSGPASAESFFPPSFALRVRHERVASGESALVFGYGPPCAPGAAALSRFPSPPTNVLL